jgi:hypothetical protein
MQTMATKAATAIIDTEKTRVVAKWFKDVLFIHAPLKNVYLQSAASLSVRALPGFRRPSILPLIRRRPAISAPLRCLRGPVKAHHVIPQGEQNKVPKVS